MARRKRKLEPVVIDNGEKAVRKVDGTPLYGKDAARYVQKLAEMRNLLRKIEGNPVHYVAQLMVFVSQQIELLTVSLSNHD